MDFNVHRIISEWRGGGGREREGLILDKRKADLVY